MHLNSNLINVLIINFCHDHSYDDCYYDHSYNSNNYYYYHYIIKNYQLEINTTFVASFTFEFYQAKLKDLHLKSKSLNYFYRNKFHGYKIVIYKIALQR